LESATNQFVLPKFQTKVKSLFDGLFAIEKRTKFLQEYMNGLFAGNQSAQLRQLLCCTIFASFIDLDGKFQSGRGSARSAFTVRICRQSDQ